MKVIVDADACPVTKQAEDIAKQYHVPCVLVCDFNHVLKSDYSTVFTVDKGQDSADYKIHALVERGDVVVTQDYGLASLVLSKDAHAIHQSGRIFTADTMDQLLFERYLSAKNRKAGFKMPNMKKRTRLDDEKFIKSFRFLIEENVK